MSKPLISVIVATYFPEKEKLMATLRSIILQKDCSFEIIIADDGSDNFYEHDICDYLDSVGVCDYQILAHAENQATVKNLLDGARNAKGKYIKTISPGDLLYDAYTLHNACAFMEKYGAKVAFGEMVFYTNEGNQLNIVHGKLPCDSRLYEVYERPYNYRKVLKHQLVYSDFISGAADLYEREAFCAAMEEIQGTVLYAEDSAYQLFAAKNVRIYKVPYKLVWYEYGTGISTNTESALFSRIDQDFYNFYQMMMQKYANTPYLKRAWRFWNRRLYAGNLKKQFFRLVSLDKCIFSIRRWILRNLSEVEYDSTFFEQCTVTDSKYGGQ